ncbi:auxin-responsive protein SAUR71 [Cajanus cajan]|uniref:Auxin-induced protein 15A n=1 Tax=Cajanus cajan TaxID=3821 RepID=A0A151TDE8_CAJCA|nr:auxin-responsive protein SAUR71 [Cajanus cajan]KYP65043.1 Auxin-induced protein 15A [Cajanus cajan]
MDDGVMRKKKGGLITKTWERCKSIGRGRKVNSSNPVAMTLRSKSWPSREGSKSKKSSVTPEGCFCVYVGPQMQRFVIKTEYANHPLFKMLLEEAESEYGYNSQGPLALPCHVDIFYKVLMEMDCEETRQGCTCVNRSPSAYRLLRTSSMHALNPF